MRARMAHRVLLLIVLHLITATCFRSIVARPDTHRGVPVLRRPALPFQRWQTPLLTLVEPISSVAHLSAPLWGRDVACAGTLVLATSAWIRICNSLSNNGYISSSDSRKLMHITNGPFFLLSWPFFSSTRSGYVAALAVPVLSALRLLIAGRSKEGSSAEADLVKAISRTGSRREALGGPMVYTLVLLSATLFGWRSIVSVVAVAQMAVGDGMADIIGRRFGTYKWPLGFAKQKSVVGTVAFASCAFLACVLMLSLYRAAGMTSLVVGNVVPSLMLISVICSLVELVPFGDDNWTVPMSGALLSFLLLAK